MSGPWNIAGLTILGAGLVLAAWALFADRSRGRRRCCRCWYDMKGTPGLTCPECGRVHRGERDLLRTRRRWRRAALFVLAGLLASQACFAAPRARARGWPGLVPTSVLMVGAVWAPPPPGPWTPRDDVPEPSAGLTLGTELVERLTSPATWCWQKDLFQRVCAEETAPVVAGGGFDAYSRALAWLVQSRECGVFSPWAYKPYLAAAAPRLLRFRSKWVTGRPFAIHEGASWMPAFPPGRLAFEVSEAGQLLGASKYTTDMEIGTLAPGIHDLDVMIRLREEGDAGLLHPEGVWSMIQRVRVEVFPTLDGLMPRRSDAEMRAAIVESMTLEAVNANEVYLLAVLRDEPWRRVPLSVRVDQAPRMEVVLESAGRAPSLRWRFFWPAKARYGQRPMVTWTYYDDAWRDRMRTGMNAEAFEGQHLHVRVVGDPDESLAREDSTCFWEGELRFTAEARMGVMHLVPVLEGTR